MSFNFMAAVTHHSDFGALENKICHCFPYFPIFHSSATFALAQPGDPSPWLALMQWTQGMKKIFIIGV